MWFDEDNIAKWQMLSFSFDKEKAHIFLSELCNLTSKEQEQMKVKCILSLSQATQDSIGIF